MLSVRFLKEARAFAASCFKRKSSSNEGSNEKEVRGDEEEAGEGRGSRGDMKGGHKKEREGNAIVEGSKKEEVE